MAPSFLLSFNLKLMSGFLYSEYAKATNQNIQLSFDIKNYNIHTIVPEYVLTLLIGILFDNAIEACKLCEDKKHIWFKCVQESGKIILSVKNTYCDMNRIKKEGLHGIGLKNVEHVITSYGGTYSIKKIQGKFIVTILFWMEE